MPAACIATSVPLDIAIPISAAANAGASLMPSPTIATKPWARFNCATILALSSGNTCAYTWLIPSWLPTLVALPWLSPEIMTVSISWFCNRFIAEMAVGFSTSPNANIPSKVDAADDMANHEILSPCASSDSEATFNATQSTPNSSIKRALPKYKRWSPTKPTKPLPGKACSSSTGCSNKPLACAALTTALASGCSLPTCRLAARVNK